MSAINKPILESDKPILAKDDHYHVALPAYGDVYENGEVTGGSTDFIFDGKKGQIQTVTITGTINKFVARGIRPGCTYILVIGGTSPAFTSFDTGGTLGSKMFCAGGSADMLTLTASAAENDIITIVGIGKEIDSTYALQNEFAGVAYVQLTTAFKNS